MQWAARALSLANLSMVNIFNLLGVSGSPGFH